MVATAVAAVATWAPAAVAVAAGVVGAAGAGRASGPLWPSSESLANVPLAEPVEPESAPVPAASASVEPARSTIAAVVAARMESRRSTGDRLSTVEAFSTGDRGV
jgi:hypothetical protein